MTDLGFGLVDKRSVLAVLLAFFLSVALFNNPLPINTSNATDLFASIVLLTGFCFAVRSMIRLLISIPTIIIWVVVRFFKNKRDDRQHPEYNENNLPKPVVKLLRESLYDLYSGFIDLLFANQDWDKDFSLESIILGILDRVLLVFAVFIATIPSYSTVRDSLGIIGIILMLLVYILTGGYTLFVKDAIKKADEDHRELIPPTTVSVDRLPSDSSYR